MPCQPIGSDHAYPFIQCIFITGSLLQSRQALRGKVWIGDFIYTNCPGPCPRMTQHLKRIQDEAQALIARALRSP